LRYCDNDRVLWIDAVCIDQDDLEERANQVAMMDVIYSNTFRNLIWLGDDEGGTAEQALNTIETVLEEENGAMEKCEAILGAEERFAHEDIENEVRKRVTDDLSASLDQLSELPLLQYFASDWFTRLWVFQEASLAPESICYRGETRVPLEKILHAARWIMFRGARASRFLSPGIQKAAQLSKFAIGAGMYHPSQGDTMLRLLNTTNHFQAHDPRDHVYAVVGLYKRISGNTYLSSMLMPNYKIGMAETFRNATLFTIQESRGLAVLCVVDRLMNERTYSIPTWVHRWDRTPDGKVDTSHMALVYKPDGDKQLSLADMRSKDPDILPVVGFVLDLIVERTDAITVSDLHPREAFNKITTAVQELKWRISKQAAERFERMLGITLIAGSHDGMHQADAAESASTLAELKSMAFSDEIVSMPDPSGDHRKRLYEYSFEMTKQCNNRCLFSTASGYFGLGPQTLKSTDVLAVIYGCPLPLVLHPVDMAASKCELVGVCYVHDIMDGAAFHQHQASGRKDVKFFLV
jgi:hypothetical protein